MLSAALPLPLVAAAAAAAVEVEYQAAAGCSRPAHAAASLCASIAVWVCGRAGVWRVRGSQLRWAVVLEPRRAAATILGSCDCNWELCDRCWEGWASCICHAVLR